MARCVASGAATAFYLLPGSRFGVLALTNGIPVGAPEAVCLSALDLAQRGSVSRDWLALIAPIFAALGAPNYGTELLSGTPPASGPALPNTAYVGRYCNDFYGVAEVAAAGDHLTLRLGPKPLEFPLAHLGRDTFTWQPAGENAYARSALSFTIRADGVASEFADDYLASGGPGTLVWVGR